MRARIGNIEGDIVIVWIAVGMIDRIAQRADGVGVGGGRYDQRIWRDRREGKVAIGSKGDRR